MILDGAVSPLTLPCPTTKPGDPDVYMYSAHYRRHMRKGGRNLSSVPSPAYYSRRAVRRQDQVVKSPAEPYRDIRIPNRAVLTFTQLKSDLQNEYKLLQALPEEPYSY